MRLADYEMGEETYLKCKVLTKGIVFSEAALKAAAEQRAKGQNLVYNMPVHAAASRPQEIWIRNKRDGYCTVSSCVAPEEVNEAVYLDVDQDGRLTAKIHGAPIGNIEAGFVREPEYYKKTLQNGESVKKYVSACGLDELNILPWKGCAISKVCRFCGANHFITQDDLSAHKIDEAFWNEHRDGYLSNLKEALAQAIDDDCYREHMHVILIAGNLSNQQLDLESRIFGEIARAVYPVVKFRATEGIVLVVTPPKDMGLLYALRDSGVARVVFNVEAITEEGFAKYCPGKAELGYSYFFERLTKAVEVFGRGNVWSNLVLGLEPVDRALERCGEYARKGIVVSANVLHLDKGNTLDCKVPSEEDVLAFFHGLERINAQNGYAPYYCAKALRTSLSNEAHDNRILKKGV